MQEEKQAFMLAGEIVTEVMQLFIKTMQEQRRREYEKLYQAWDAAELSAKALIDEGRQHDEEARAAIRFEFVKTLTGNPTLQPMSKTIN